MTPFTAGVNRTLRALRTGDRRGLAWGIILLLWGAWRSRRHQEAERIVKTTVRPGETLVIRGNRLGDVGREPTPPPPAQIL